MDGATRSKSSPAPWPKKRNSKPRTRTLSFDDAGRAIRILIREFGARPYMNYNRNPPRSQWNMKRKCLDHRMVIWDAKAKPQAERAASALLAAGITDFRLTPRGWFYIRIPKDCFASSFYRSDDPQEWSRKEKQRHDAIKIREVEWVLDYGLVA